MTAPIWIASPPEVHSTLLSAGPGAGPLLASASAWGRLGAEYAEVADELTQLLGAVQAGSWQGPSAEAFVAAAVPYLAWLAQTALDSVVTAAQQEAAAAAYTGALAAMPTPAELAANHALHGVLVATNFFGVNTVPIAVNEADYGRMWVQAATVMSGYHAVATATVTSSPRTTNAPQIAKSGSAADDSTGDSTWPPLPPDTEQDIMNWMTSHGYLDFYNNVIQPMVNALSNNPYLQSLFNGFDPYLASVGNPLSFLSPFNIAFMLGYPMTFSQYAAFLSETFGFIGADLTAAFASGNPATMGMALLFAASEAIFTVITDTIALLKTLLEQALVLIPVMLPLMTAALAPLALAAPLPGLAGLAGLAGLHAIPAVPPVAPMPAPIAPPPAPAPAPAAAPAPPAAPAPATPAPAPSPPAPPPPPSPAGPPVVPAQMFGYLVGGLGAQARRGRGGAARRAKAAEARRGDDAEAPDDVPEPVRKQRRRRSKVGMLGRGYEYMDLEPEQPPIVSAPGSASTSESGAGPFGFAGAVQRRDTAPAGLTALDDHPFGGRPSAPMMPGTWDND